MSDEVNYKAGEALTVSSSAVGFTVATVAANDRAVITVAGAAVRFRADGTDPTAAIGHILEVGDTVVLDSKAQVSKFRAIRKDGVDATLHCSFGTRGG